MYVPKTDRWAEPLRHTLRRVYEPTTRNPVPWLLTGDTALALQGVNVDPGLVEFRAMSSVATAYFAQFMRPHEVSINGATIVYRRGGNAVPSENWRSNVHQRIVAWSGGGRACWLGRWHVDGTTVQVSYLRSIFPDPVALAVRTGARRVHFEGMEVAVVPIEFLLVENAMRNDTHTVHRILNTIRVAGQNHDNLRIALDLLPEEKATRLLRLLEIGLVED
jgi:hypothetical protein